MMTYVIVMLTAIAVLVFAPISRERGVRTTTQGLAGLVFAVGLVSFMTRLLGPMA